MEKIEKPERNKQIRELYEAGLTTKELAEKFDLHITSIQRVVRGLPNPQILERNKRNLKIAAMYLSGEHNTEQIAQHYGMRRSAIRSILINLGVPRGPVFKRQAIAHFFEKNPTMNNKDIGKHFGVSDSTVQEAIAEVFPNLVGKHSEKCSVCGKDYIASSRKNKRCPECRRKYPISKKIKTCPICGRGFRPRTRRNRANKVQTFCSPECGQIGQKLDSKRVQRDLNIRILYKKYKSPKRVAKLTGVSRATVMHLCTSDRSRRKHLLDCLEVIYRHKNKKWLSVYAKLELKYALNRYQDILKNWDLFESNQIPPKKCANPDCVKSFTPTPKTKHQKFCSPQCRKSSKLKTRSK